MSGILYVVFNESFRNPETNERYYKIGITKNSVSDRYHDLTLKMPGKFETLFAYRLENYEKAEKLIHGILSKYREKGEWFNLTTRELEHIKATCELMDGILVTDEVEKGIEIDNEIKISTSSKIFNIPNLTETVDINILETTLKRGILYVNDNICFHTTVDILNSFFGKEYEQGFASYGKCFFRTRQRDKYIWCPFLDNNKNNCRNTMPNENYIYEERIDLSPHIKDDNPKPRAIFVKRLGDKYRFVGIYEIEKYDNHICVHKRISTELHIKEWN